MATKLKGITEIRENILLTTNFLTITDTSLAIHYTFGGEERHLLCSSQEEAAALFLKLGFIDDYRTLETGAVEMISTSYRYGYNYSRKWVEIEDQQLITWQDVQQQHQNEQFPVFLSRRCCTDIASYQEWDKVTIPTNNAPF